MEKLLTTGQAARLCSVTPDTVLKWIKGGRIAATRTAGGHYRIAPSEVENIRTPTRTRRFEYCWEFESGDGGVRDGCQDCLVYRARAMRCYEIASLGKDAGHQKLLCDSSCQECDYFQLMKGQAANVLVVSDHPEVSETLRRQALSATFNLEIVDCEYSVSATVQSFRPDFVVIDCGLGTERARDIALHLIEDPRVQLVRIVLAAKPGEYPDGCDEKIFARMERPFGIEEIHHCISGFQDAAT